MHISVYIVQCGDHSAAHHSVAQRKSAGRLDAPPSFSPPPSTRARFRRGTEKSSFNMWATILLAKATSLYSVLRSLACSIYMVPN